MASFDRAIPPGGVGKITLSVAMEGQQGKIRKQARVYSNDPENKQMTLTLKAFVKGHKQVETPPSLEQMPGQGPAGQLPPPGGGANLSSEIPPGAESQSPLPPPLLDQGSESNHSSNTEGQVFSQSDDQTDDQNRVPDDNVSEPPDVQSLSADPTP